ncbi:hypothetical protein MBLNU13_g10078t2 [Cladosporium sp. NU13]
MADEGMPTYKMIFNAGDQLHGATTVFIFEPNDSPNANNATISSYMKDWFLSFITDVDPNANTYFNITDKPHWLVYNSRFETNGSATLELAVMDVNYTQIGVIQDLDVSAQCDFFHSSPYDVRNQMDECLWQRSFQY